MSSGSKFMGSLTLSAGKSMEETKASSMKGWGFSKKLTLKDIGKKIGLSPDIDQTTLDPAEVDELVHIKKLGNPLKQAKKEFEVDEFKRMLVQFQKDRHK
jgi:hypothetical protein